MRVKLNRRYRTIVNNIQKRRFAYFGCAAVFLFSILTYSFFFRSAPEVKAASVLGTSSVAYATSTQNQRKVVVSSNGTIVSFFDTDTISPAGIAYSKSTDGGSTWSAAVQVDAELTSDFSVAIAGNDNIYVAYTLSNGGINIRKLTYTTGNWTIGGANIVVAAIFASCASSTSVDYSQPYVAVNASGVVYVTTVAHSVGPPTCKTGYVSKAYSSSDLNSWTASTIGSSVTFSIGNYPLVAEGNNMWAISQNKLYVDIQSTGVWTLVSALTNTMSQYISVSYGFDTINIYYQTAASGLVFQSYNIATGLLSGVTTISASANDVLGSLVSDSHNLWAIYQSYVGANSYNVVYKKYNGTTSTWDTNSTALTTDNLNNANINVPERVGNNTIPLLWTEGTASPYNIKAITFSTLGTVTDTGNQSGYSTGTLTGTSGDTIVKCGIWYYNTVNIVSGMTIKVCASNGQTGGNLIIYANTVTVAGMIDGAGRGLPGGINILAVGGAGGSSVQPAGLGASFNGGAGAGSFAGAGGTKGTNASTAGATGTTSNGSAFATGGTGGTGTSSSGTAGTLAGYLSVGGNGDTSTDESQVFGGSGGAGGTGGSGAGGGGGGAGSGTVPPNCAGAGGTGGIGGIGGSAGKGGNGGANFAIYTSGNLTVSGSITLAGQSGGTGTSATAATFGASGSGANSNC